MKRWAAKMLCRLSIAVNKAGWSLAPLAWESIMTEECERDKAKRGVA